MLVPVSPIIKVKCPQTKDKWVQMYGIYRMTVKPIEEIKETILHYDTFEQLFQDVEVYGHSRLSVHRTFFRKEKQVRVCTGFYSDEGILKFRKKNFSYLSISISYKEEKNCSLDELKYNLSYKDFFQLCCENGFTI